MPNGRNEIKFHQFSDITALAGASSDSEAKDALPLRGIKPIGNFSIIVEITGTGTATLDVLVKYQLTDSFVKPAVSSTIASGLTAGTYGFPFDPMLGLYLGIRLSEGGGSNSVTASTKLAYQ